MKRVYYLLLITLPVMIFIGSVGFSSALNEITPGLTAKRVSAVPLIKTIKIWKMEFNPKRIVAEPGTTIRWFNKDSSEHDITSGTAVSGRKARQMKVSKFPDGLFQSGLFGEGQTFEISLNKKGTYTYFCNEHPDMQAVIVIK